MVLSHGDRVGTYTDLARASLEPDRRRAAAGSNNSAIVDGGSRVGAIGHRSFAYLATADNKAPESAFSYAQLFLRQLSPAAASIAPYLLQ